MKFIEVVGRFWENIKGRGEQYEASYVEVKINKANIIDFVGLEL